MPEECLIKKDWPASSGLDLYKISPGKAIASVQKICRRSGLQVQTRLAPYILDTNLRSS